MASRISSVGPFVSFQVFHGAYTTLTIFRWLLAHGRDEEAREVLGCLEAKLANDPIVIAHRNEICYSVYYGRENSVRWRDLWKQENNGTRTLRRLFLGAGTQLMQQFEGISIMSYFLPTVLMNVSLWQPWAYMVADKSPFPSMSAFRIKLHSSWQRVMLCLTCSFRVLRCC